MEPDHLQLLAEIKKVKNLLELLVYNKANADSIFKSDEESFGPTDRDLRK